jgi:hypothetical protein
MPYLDEIDTRDMGDGNSMLLKPFRYLTPDTLEIITANAFTITDFASIPRLFRAFITGNDNTKKPAVIHDRDYRDKYCSRTRKRTDQIFLMGMKENGVPRWKRYMAYVGVRTGGWAGWKTGDYQDG